MELKNQVISLDLAKQINTLLKEKGMEVKESLFAYYGNGGVWHDSIVDMSMYKDADDSFREHKLLPAYTCSELGEMLPTILDKTNVGLVNLISLKIDNIWNIMYENREYHLHKEIADTEVEARGRMLVYLLSNNLLKNDEK